MEGLKDLIKPPFANYDVVVYFGGGLFLAPFLKRYIIEPTGLSLPKLSIDVGSAFANEAVSVLILLFFIYIVGHFIAFFGSQIIEKSADRFLGKISTAVLIASVSNRSNRNASVRALIYDNVKRIKPENALLSSSVRLIAHFPIWYAYIIAYLLGIFGYYDTRLPPHVIDRARERYRKEITTEPLTIRTKWFKPIEYFVVNRFPSAAPRMYNYLVISGLFRSLCAIFLAASWLCLYFIIHYYIHGDWLIQPIMGWKGIWAGWFEYISMTLLFTFCLTSYMKFQRRYAEETIFAFAFSKMD